MGRPGPTIVLVHGAWHDQSCWAGVTAELDARGVAWELLTLPSTNPGPDLPGFAADIGAVTDLLDRLADNSGVDGGGDDGGGGVTLCGHSYGGMVVSEAGNHHTVTRLVYLAAACPVPGQSLLDRRSGFGRWFRSAIRRTDDGRAVLTPGLAGRLLYGDLDRGQAAANTAKLLPSSASILGAKAINPAWAYKPTTYVVCSRDRVISTRAARKVANRMVRSQISVGRPALPAVTLPSGHCPFFSAPALVADVLADGVY